MSIIARYFTLKKIIIFFIIVFVVLFLVGGCSLMPIDPQYYKLLKLEKDISGLYILDEKLYKEAREVREGGILQNGYKVIYEYEIDRAKIDSRIESAKQLIYSYIDANKKNIISYYLCYNYYTYGLWLVGDEGRGFGFKTGDKSICLWNDNNVFYYDKQTNTFIKKDKNDK